MLNDENEKSNLPFSVNFEGHRIMLQKTSLEKCSKKCHRKKKNEDLYIKKIIEGWRNMQV